MRISAFVVTYNRASILRACLRRARWVDELIVVDKSSTDDGATEAVARAIADRYERVLWSPTCEGTRIYAQSLCTGDWIVCLDDDEVLSVGAGAVLRELVVREPATVYYLPIVHLVLGSWNRDLEFRPAFYARGALTHHGRLHHVPEPPGSRFVVRDGSAHILHLSCPDTTAWVEKINRYTSVSRDEDPNRSLTMSPTAMVRCALDTRIANVTFVDEHHEVITVLNVLYDVVEALKVWELGRPRGTDVFRAICEEIEGEDAA